ncbi:MAG: thioredoxin [Xanthomonadales bacterium]|nr:thioredoxin [Xanthomonadales bacterium]MCB1628727.1 thioredoxin [Xanthomonadales bacterium]MCB1634172.1 thioredoxin [Xanthomonadales bacterium]
MSDRVNHVGDADFEHEVLASAEPVLVDFWAEWCEPCKRIEPVLHDLADQYGERLRVAKVNVEASPAVAAQYKVRGLPTFMIFKNGQVHSTQIGAVSKTQLSQFIDRAL